MKSKIIKISAAVALIVMLLALGIGYAAVSKDLLLGANVDGATQNDVFITDFTISGGSEMPEGTKFISTVLTSDITLDSVSKTATYTVTVYNKGSEPYCYLGTTYNSKFYNNANIAFSVTLDSCEGDWIYDDDEEYNNSDSVILGGEEMTFDITFTHTGEGTNYNLASTLKFEFAPISESQVVTLHRGEEVYHDCFLKKDTEASFKGVVLQDIENVARCNNGAVPKYEDGVLKIANVNATENNEDNTVKCELFASLSKAFTDNDFETSNYTVNNFLVLKDFTDNGERSDGTINSVQIPDSVEWNVNIDAKTVTYKAEKYFLLINTNATLNILSTELDEGQPHNNTTDVTMKRLGGIYFAESDSGFARIRNDNAVLTITGGRYENKSSNALLSIAYGGIEANIGGKLIVKNAVIQTQGDAFYVGTTAGRERRLTNESLGYDPMKQAGTEAGTAYNAHLEIMGCKVTSTAGNVLHSITRQNFFCNLFDSFFVTEAEGQNVIQADDDAGEEEASRNIPTGIYAYENAKIYMHYCNFNANENALHFYTHGTRMFYTVRFGLGDGSLFMKSGKGGAAYKNRIDDNCLRIKSFYGRAESKGGNFPDRVYDDANAATWFYIRDEEGNILLDDTVDSNTGERGKPLRVGDELQILSRYLLNSEVRYIWGFAEDEVPESGVAPKLIQSSNTSVKRRWMLLPSDTPGYYHISTYSIPTLSLVNNGDCMVLQNHMKNMSDDPENEIYVAYNEDSKFNMKQALRDANICYSFSYNDNGTMKSICGGESDTVLTAEEHSDQGYNGQEGGVWDKQFWRLTIAPTKKA